MYGERVYGPLVDDAIQQDVYPGGQPAVVYGGQVDTVRATVAALEVVERHLEPVTDAQLAALALLRHVGGAWAELAEWWLAHHHRRGGSGVLVEALEHATLLRHFRGVNGSLFGGRRGLFGPGVGR